MERKQRKLSTNQLVVHEKKVAEMHAAFLHLKKKYAVALKQANTGDRIIGEMHSCIPRLPKAPVPKLNDKLSRIPKESVVLLGSCWHIGEIIDRQEMGGLNSYDFQEFVRRFQFLVDTTIDFTMRKMHGFSYEELHVVLLGDMVSGMIHEELEITNELTVVDQALLGAHVVAQGIRELAQWYPKVHVTGIVGNHGRIRQEKRYKYRGHESWDRVFYEALALLLRAQTNVTFTLPRSFWGMLTIQGHTFYAAHGDSVQSHMSIPFYGLKRETSQWSRIMGSQGTFIEYVLLSHFHTKAILQDIHGELIMNGSLKGGDEYAISKGLYSEPIQLLFGVHAEKGKTWELSLKPRFLEPDTPLRYSYTLGAPLADQP